MIINGEKRISNDSLLETLDQKNSLGELEQLEEQLEALSNMIVVVSDYSPLTAFMLKVARESLFDALEKAAGPFSNKHYL